jgi:MFS family permease
MGRARVVTVAMSTAAVLSLLTGWSATAPAVFATALVVLWKAATYFDSSALTAGTVQAADKELRGAAMGLHSMRGYAGGFMGPLGVGLVLDWTGSAQGWGLAFGHLALITLTGLFVLRRLGARSAMQTMAASSTSKVTVARYSRAGSWWRQHRRGRRARRWRSSAPRPRAAKSRRIGRA